MENNIRFQYFNVCKNSTDGLQGNFLQDKAYWITLPTQILCRMFTNTDPVVVNTQTQDDGAVLHKDPPRPNGDPARAHRGGD